MSHNLFVVRIKKGEGGAQLVIPHLAKLAEAGERAPGFTASDAHDITARGGRQDAGGVRLTGWAE